jgi:hypothetical protein
LHNIIRQWDPEELDDTERQAYVNPVEAVEIFGAIAEGVPTDAERQQMSGLRDEIAAAMWASYAAERERRGDPVANVRGV